MPRVREPTGGAGPVRLRGEIRGENDDLIGVGAVLYLLRRGELLHVSLSLSAARVLALLLAVSGSRLDDRIASLHGVMKNEEIDAYATRNSLKGYFLTDDDLSSFIVGMLQKMLDHGFTERRIRGWRIDRSVRMGDEQKVELTITGKGFLFFPASFTVTEEWVNKDGEWYILPSKVIIPGR